ncbi:MAG: hypothetical protein ABUL68_05725, partial [Pseudomonadota bacterium]
MKRLLPLLLVSCLSFTAGCAGDQQDLTALPPPASTTVAAPAKGAPTVYSEASAEEDAWPRTIKRDGATYTIYQPQLDAWDGVTLEARAAVAVQADGAKEATYGIIFLRAETTIDREERLVHFEKLFVTKTQFPSLTDPYAYL